MREDVENVSGYFNLDPRNININNIIKRNLGKSFKEKLTLEWNNSSSHLNRTFTNSNPGIKAPTYIDKNNKKHNLLDDLLLVLYKGNGTIYKDTENEEVITAEKARTILNDDYNIGTADVFITTEVGGGSTRTIDSPWTAAMWNLVSEYNNGAFNPEKDINLLTQSQ